jgi:hypothetical protein
MNTLEAVDSEQTIFFNRKDAEMQTNGRNRQSADDDDNISVESFRSVTRERTGVNTSFLWKSQTDNNEEMRHMLKDITSCETNVNMNGGNLADENLFNLNKNGIAGVQRGGNYNESSQSQPSMFQNRTSPFALRPNNGENAGRTSYENDFSQNYRARAGGHGDEQLDSYYPSDIPRMRSNEYNGPNKCNMGNFKMSSFTGNEEWAVWLARFEALAR